MQFRGQGIGGEIESDETGGMAYGEAADYCRVRGAYD